MLGLYSAQTARADDDLGGMPVYVFIPNPFPGGYIFGTQRCKGPVDSQTFIGADLPNANEIVALKADRGTCREQDIDRERDQFQPPFVDVAKAVEGCQVEWHEPNAQVLQAGSKLRILGYRTFVGHHSDRVPRGGVGLASSLRALA